MRGDDVFVLDVREPHEYEINRIGGSTLIPLGELAERFSELDARDIVVQCKSGRRSARAASFLREHGFKNVKNLKGGILAWVTEIDPSQPKDEPRWFRLVRLGSSGFAGLVGSWSGWRYDQRLCR